MRQLYKVKYYEKVNGLLVNERTSKLFYGEPSPECQLLFNTTDFDEFYKKTAMPKDVTIFKREPYVFTWGGSKKFKKKDFKEYTCIASAITFPISDFSFKDLQEQLSADEYIELYKDLTKNKT